MHEDVDSTNGCIPADHIYEITCFFPCRFHFFDSMMVTFSWDVPSNNNFHWNLFRTFVDMPHKLFQGMWLNSSLPNPFGIPKPN